MLNVSSNISSQITNNLSAQKGNKNIYKISSRRRKTTTTEESRIREVILIKSKNKQTRKSQTSHFRQIIITIKKYIIIINSTHNVIKGKVNHEGTKHIKKRKLEMQRKPEQISQTVKKNHKLKTVIKQYFSHTHTRPSVTR